MREYSGVTNRLNNILIGCAEADRAAKSLLERLVLLPVDKKVIIDNATPRPIKEKAS